MNLKSQLSEEEIRQVAELHFTLLNDGFLASFGKDFLYLLYQELNLSCGSTIIVSYENSRIIGFISGGTGLKNVYIRLLKNPLRLLMAILPQLLKKHTLLKLFSLLNRKRLRSKGGLKTLDAELYSICVMEQYQGSTVAKQLYKQLCNYFAKMDIDEFMIVVGDKLFRAKKFYIKQGAVPIGLLKQGHGKKSVIFKHKM